MELFNVLPSTQRNRGRQTGELAPLLSECKHGKSPHRNNVELGRHGRFRTNVWEYPGFNSFERRGEEGNLLALHPTIKPVQLVADAILDCTDRNDIVLDAFLGSGSTLIAAERVGRRLFVLFLAPPYRGACGAGST
jgi:adenine specific DNA methylase Mod